MQITNKLRALLYSDFGPVGGWNQEVADELETALADVDGQIALIQGRSNRLACALAALDGLAAVFPMPDESDWYTQHELQPRLDFAYNVLAAEQEATLTETPFPADLPPMNRGRFGWVADRRKEATLV